MKMFHLTIGFVSTSVIVALCFIGCGVDGGSDECPALSVEEDAVETEVIEQYPSFHQKVPILFQTNRQFMLISVMGLLKHV
jgi:hypothetical protein